MQEDEEEEEDILWRDDHTIEQLLASLPSLLVALSSWLFHLGKDGRRLFFDILQDFSNALSWTMNAALIASSNTSFNPMPVRADVSIYLNAFTLVASLIAASRLIGDCPIDERATRVSRSSRRSIFVPTNIIGVRGLWWRSSGIHLTVILSNDGGDTTEKHRRNTSVCG